ncbi:hypothetical protein [Hungatella hathewayi]|uniref:hypothetical protein n=1 Tax=Hungatella hathewayi TaxID=154046 RepID=UPI0035635C82
MARGVRKSPMEKLQEQINEVRESIKQYENCLVALKEKEKELQDQIDLEEFKSVRGLLTEQGIGMEELKEMLESNVTAVEKQSA